MLDRLEEEVGLLIKLAKNIKKSIHTPYRRETLELKLQYAEDLFDDIEATFLECKAEIPQENLNFLIRASREALYSIKTIIKSKLELLEEKNKIAVA